MNLIFWKFIIIYYHFYTASLASFQLVPIQLSVRKRKLNCYSLAIGNKWFFLIFASKFLRRNPLNKLELNSLHIVFFALDSKYKLIVLVKFEYLSFRIIVIDSRAYARSELLCLLLRIFTSYYSMIALLLLLLLFTLIVVPLCYFRVVAFTFILMPLWIVLRTSVLIEFGYSWFIAKILILIVKTFLIVF